MKATKNYLRSLLVTATFGSIAFTECYTSVLIAEPPTLNFDDVVAISREFLAAPEGKRDELKAKLIRHGGPIDPVLQTLTAREFPT